MRKKIKQLKDLDKILRYISEKRNSEVTEKEMFGEKHISGANVDYLLSKRFIYRTNTPVKYKISEEGRIFVSNGGFVSEYKRSIFDRFINSTHLIVSTIVLIISLLFTYYSKKQNSKEIYYLEISISNLSSKVDSLMANQQLQNDSLESLEKQYNKLYLKINSEYSQPVAKNLVNLADSI